MATTRGSQTCRRTRPLTPLLYHGARRRRAASHPQQGSQVSRAGELAVQDSLDVGADEVGSRPGSEGKRERGRLALAAGRFEIGHDLQRLLVGRVEGE